MSLKSTENELYLYFNQRFRIGWSSREVTHYYNSLTLTETIVEAQKINDFMYSDIVLWNEDQISINPKLVFTITDLAKKVYLSREELHRLSKISVVSFDESANLSILEDDGNPNTINQWDPFTDNI